MLGFFLSYLLVYKYFVVFVVVFLASLGLPMPATAILVAAGAFAAQGYFDMVTVLLVSASASILGDSLSYTVSYQYGRKFLYRIGLKKILKSAKFISIERMFVAHVYVTVFTTRFIATSIGPSVNLLAGLSKIRFQNFFLTIFCGEIIYTCLFVGLGYIFGEQWESILSISQDITSIVVLIIVLILLITLWIRSNRSKKGKRKKSNTRQIF